MTKIIINFLIYLRAELSSQRPITKYAKIKKDKKGMEHDTKQLN
jgi:hypothetical protein